MTGRAIAHFPTLGKIYGSNSALLLSILCFWDGKGVDPEWVYKTANEIYDETGLTEEEQRSARARLVTSGAIKEDRRGIHRKMWFQVQWDAIESHLTSFQDDPKFKAYSDKRRNNKQPQKLVLDNSEETCGGNFREQVLDNSENKSPIIPTTIQSKPELTTKEIWDSLPSARNAQLKDNGLIPVLPEEKHLFDALNTERKARNYVSFVRFKTTKQREKFRGCVAFFNGSTNTQIDEIIANGKTDIAGVVNALDWRRRNNTPLSESIQVQVPNPVVDMSKVIIR